MNLWKTPKPLFVLSVITALSVIFLPVHYWYISAILLLFMFIAGAVWIASVYLKTKG